MKHVIRIAILALTVVLSTMLRTNADASENADSLYIGDQTDSFATGNTVKRFNAETGAYLGAFVTSNSGGLHGPRGLIFSQRGEGERGDLLVVNQNQDLSPLSGAVLRFNGETGAFLKAIVPATDTSSPNANPNAPFAPRGMVLWNHEVLFVAEFVGVMNAPGRLLAFTKNGEFLANLTPGVLP